ncbi:PRC-barrel domain-containing protein [Gordonia terrae]
MIASDLLSCTVRGSDGDHVGHVIDLRFEVVDGELRLVGLLVNRRNRVSFLGYERQGVARPWVLNRFFAWLHRGTVLIPWADVTAVDDGAVRLRDGFRRLDASLDTARDDGLGPTVDG